MCLLLTNVEPRLFNHDLVPAADGLPREEDALQIQSYSFEPAKDFEILGKSH